MDKDGFVDEPVDVRADHVRVRRLNDDVGVREVKNKFGGIDIPAALAGALAALGLSLLLGALLAGAGAFTRNEGAVDDDALRTGAVVAGLLTAAVATAFGAWVAGRMARYDGGRNGLLAALLFVLSLGAISGAGLGLGDEATDGDVGARLSDWWDADAFGPLGIAGAIGTILALLGVGYLFGRLGSRYHRRADELLVKTRDGGLGRPSTIATSGTTSASTSLTGTSSTGTSADLNSGITRPGTVSGASRDLERDLRDASRDRQERRP